tara:strand:- start:3408 stop:3737 length:330 start_codon:yes stop_codon:yes gene_type:complete
MNMTTQHNNEATTTKRGDATTPSSNALLSVVERFVRILAVVQPHVRDRHTHNVLVLFDPTRQRSMRISFEKESPETLDVSVWTYKNRGVVHSTIPDKEVARKVMRFLNQ